MKIDNSAFQSWWECPTLYKAGFVDGWQRPKPYLELGSRFHAYLKTHYTGNPLPPKPDELSQAIEDEVGAIFEGYRAFYPIEPFDVVDGEKRFEIPLGKPFCLKHFNRDLELDGESSQYRCPDCEYMSCNAGQHFYIGRYDLRVRDKDRSVLQLMETKTEARNSKRNLPKVWVAKTQASMYLWAAEQVYGEPLDSVILNVATKGSEKGRVGPTFRRDTLQRTPFQIQQAINDFIYVADQMERMFQIGTYPRNTNSCVSENGWECDNYGPCHFGIEHSEAAGFVHIKPFSYLSL